MATRGARLERHSRSDRVRNATAMHHIKTKEFARAG
jgi:hypothetical protein